MPRSAASGISTSSGARSQPCTPRAASARERSNTGWGTPTSPQLSGISRSPTCTPTEPAIRSTPASRPSPPGVLRDRSGLGTSLPTAALIASVPLAVGSGTATWRVGVRVPGLDTREAQPPTTHRTDFAAPRKSSSLYGGAFAFLLRRTRRHSSWLLDLSCLVVPHRP